MIIESRMPKEDILKEIEKLPIGEIEQVVDNIGDILKIAAARDIINNTAVDNREKVRQLYGIFYTECGNCWRDD